jgi:uncharacterized membrane protein YgaE (UPF0421/DUF939 family)
MLRFLHKIRRESLANKALGKYFWYAIGEILLVVVGILIALQINNWNEERIEQKQIREYALSLVGDLQSDIEMLIPVGKQIDHLIQLSNELASYMQGRSLADINNINLYVYTLNPLYRPFEWNRAALDQLKSSGALRQIKNQQLVKKISEYDALTRHLDQDYDNDDNNIRVAMNVALKVVNMNYPNREQISVYDDDVSEDLVAAFFDSELYREIRRNDLVLLTDDINEVRHVVNTFLVLSSSLDARTRIEFPRLKANGLEIIELINAEYQQ